MHAHAELLRRRSIAKRIIPSAADEPLPGELLATLLAARRAETEAARKR